MTLVDRVVVLPMPRIEAPEAPWSAPTRVAFRFFSLYFTIYVVGTQMLTGLIALPVGNLPDLGFIGPPRKIVEWTALHVFGVTRPLVVTGSGSGDKTFDWVQAFCFLVLATAGTIAWSALARRASYPRLYKWFRLFLRLSLGSTLMGYGAAKAIPLQMPYPPLARLLEPFGQFSPMGVLWYSIGASRSYEIFTGCVELSAGILLFIPHTATLGAIVSLIATCQIFMLNMTYDVPVKLFSFHLVLMSLFLLAPDARGVLDALVLNRRVQRAPVPHVGTSARAIRVGIILQAVLAIYLVGVNLKGSVDRWKTFGGGAPKSPLYGIWNVAQMSVDGVERLPLVTDNGRWRRIVFDTPARAAFQRMDDTFAAFGAKIDMDAKSVTLSKPADAKWSATFSFQQTASDRLILDGEMDGGKVQLRLELFPRDKLLLVTRGFNWIQEYPFNR